MKIKVASIFRHRNGGKTASYQVLFRVLRDREYSDMMATVFYIDEIGHPDLEYNAYVNVVNLNNTADNLDPDYFRLIHPAIAVWYESWDGSAYTQKFPFVVE